MYLTIEQGKPTGFSNIRLSDSDVEVNDDELYLEGYTVVDGVVSYDANYQVAFDVRLQRDSLLAQSDWTQVADAPVDKTAWQVYRQALRDISDQAGFPTDIVWPTKP